MAKKKGWQSCLTHGTHLGPGLSYLPGDANLSGVVDAADLNRVGINWLQQAPAWSAGEKMGS